MSKAREGRLAELGEKELIEEAIREYALEKTGKQPVQPLCEVLDGRLIVLRNGVGVGVLAVYRIDMDADYLYRPSQHDAEYLVGWNDAKNPAYQ